MPPVLTKAVDGDDEEEERRKASVRKRIRFIYAHMGMNILISLLVAPTRVHLLKQIRPGTTAADLNRVLTLWGAVTSTIEVLFQPTFGKLSDSIGRKPFFLVTPLANLFLKSLVAVFPTTLTLSIESVVGDGLRILATTMISASVTDLTEDPKELAGNLAGVMSSAGIGLLTGPLVGGFVSSAAGGSLKAPFVASAIASIAHLSMVGLLIKEPLAPEKRRPFQGYVNPLDFTKLFTSGDSQFTLSNTIIGMNFCCETKNYANANSLYCLETLKLTPQGSARLLSLTGGALIMQAPCARVCTSFLGLSGYTTLANALTAIAHCLRGSVPFAWASFTAVIMGFVSEGRLNPNKARSTRLSEKFNMGKGELAGYTANLRAVVALSCTILYGRVYNVGLKFNQPGAPFLLVGLISVLTEVMCRSTR